ncbi:hypothetical protein BKA65DRAFT_467615 [Rhexocercosporidium sp. MPI-PUGE-AT-0058]|nr:hypothetical protein BKA65DRAFT_467615 [Rhexocercosporidium sp. MPI-PUGE-AT-0058]
MNRQLAPLHPLASRLSATRATAGLDRIVINSIWNTNWTPLDYRSWQKNYSAYFDNIYTELCTAACSGEERVPSYTHEQLLKIINVLKDEDKTKDEIVLLLPTISGFDPLHHERVLNLAAGLLVPLNFRGVGGARRGKLAVWRPDETLKQLVAAEVQLWTGSNSLTATNTPCSTCISSTSFPRRFSAWHLRFLAGFNIIWTNNLSDHLQILVDEVDTSVYIFHQVKILELHQNIASAIIPPDVITETFATLALLFPVANPKSRKWYRNLQETYHLDPGTFNQPYLRQEDYNIQLFKHWGPRLSKIKRAFDDHEPNGPIQWWRDDRRPVQWWTFWTAVLVLILTVTFGLIQSVASILQVLKA